MEMETVQKAECSWTGSAVFDVRHGYFFLSFAVNHKPLHVKYTDVLKSGKFDLWKPSYRQGSWSWVFKFHLPLNESLTGDLL